MSGLLVPPTKVGNPVRLSGDGYPEMMDIGAMIAWELVPPVTTDTTLAEGTIVRNGGQYIELGTTLVKVTSTNGGSPASAVGKYAPFDSSKTNGQQTLTRGDCGLLDCTIVKHVPHLYAVPLDTDKTGLIIGGLVIKPRLKVGGTNQPTLAALLAALPKVDTSRSELPGT